MRSSVDYRVMQLVLTRSRVVELSHSAQSCFMGTSSSAETEWLRLLWSCVSGILQTDMFSCKRPSSTVWLTPSSSIRKHHITPWVSYWHDTYCMWCICFSVLTHIWELYPTVLYFGLKYSDCTCSQCVRNKTWSPILSGLETLAVYKVGQKNIKSA